MGRAVPLRGDFDAARLRDLAKVSTDAKPEVLSQFVA